MKTTLNYTRKKPFENAVEAMKESIQPAIQTMPEINTRLTDKSVKEVIGVINDNLTLEQFSLLVEMISGRIRNKVGEYPSLDNRGFKPKVVLAACEDLLSDEAYAQVRQAVCDRRSTRLGWGEGI